MVSFSHFILFAAKLLETFVVVIWRDFMYLIIITLNPYREYFYVIR